MWFTRPESGRRPLTSARRALRAAVFAAVFAAAPPALVAQRAELALDARVGVVTMIEAELRANYEKLRTWSGSYELTDEAFRATLQSIASAPDPHGRVAGSEKRGRFWETRHVLAQFAVDFTKNRLFSTYEVIGNVEILDLTTNEVRQVDSYPFRERHVLTADEWIRARPAVTPGAEPFGPRRSRGRGVNSATVDVAEKASTRSTYSSVIDPRVFYGVNMDRRMTFAAALHSSAEWLTEGKTLPLTIIEEASAAGPVYEFVQEFRVGGMAAAGPATVVKMTFDPAVGYNPTRLIQRSEKGNTTSEREWEWEYQSVGAVFIPSRFRVAKYFDTDSKEREIVREYRLRACQVNEPIDEDSFSWDRLGLVEGDQVRDLVQRKILRYDGERMVPSTEFKDDRDADLERGAAVTLSRGRWTTLLMVNVGFFAVCALLFVLKRRRRASVN